MVKLLVAVALVFTNTVYAARDADSLKLSDVDKKSFRLLKSLEKSLPFSPEATAFDALFAQTVEKLIVNQDVGRIRPVIRLSNLAGKKIYHLGAGVVVISGGMLREYPNEESFASRFADILAQAIVRDRYGSSATEPVVWRSTFEPWVFCTEAEVASENNFFDEERTFTSDAKAVTEYESLRDKFSAAARGQRVFKGYENLRRKVLANAYQIYGELCESKNLKTVNDLYVQGSWKKILEICRYELRRRPMHEFWRWLEAVSLAAQNQPAACVALTDTRWGPFDSRRRHLYNLCIGLAGNWSKAVELADHVAREKPRDYQARFYRSLLRARARLPIREDILELERLWGDRPGTRALKAIYFGASGKPDKAADLVFFSGSFDQYDAWERGALLFSNAWLKNMYAPEFGDERSDVLLEESSKFWGLSKALWPHFARTR